MESEATGGRDGARLTSISPLFGERRGESGTVVRSTDWTTSPPSRGTDLQRIGKMDGALLGETTDEART